MTSEIQTSPTYCDKSVVKFSLRFFILFVILPMIGFGTIPSGKLYFVLLNFRLTEELENDACDQMYLDSNDIRFCGV